MRNQGKSVLSCEGERLRVVMARVLRRDQIVEDQADVACQALNGRGDARLGSGLNEAYGETAQGGEVLRTVTFADGAAIFIPVPVEELVAGIFDGPMTAIVGQQAGGIGGLRGVAGESEDGFDGGLAGFLGQVMRRERTKTWPRPGKSR